MKLSFLASAPYQGHVENRGQWPVPPVACDPVVAARSLNHSLELARRADAVGFDWVSVSEHHYGPTMLTPNPLVWAGALTQVVTRAKIALLGPLLPINNPVRLAEEAAMLDCLSGGRIIVLFLRGTPMETKVYGSKVEDTRGATQEGIDLILKAWTDPAPFAWEGEHHKYSLVNVWPRPLQSPYPPMFSSGNSEESVIFAAQRRLGLAISFASPEQVAKSVELYRNEADKAGWAPTADNVLYRAIAQVAESDAAAADQAAEMQARRTAMPAGLFAPRFHGGPTQVLEQIDAFRAAGVGVIDLALGAVAHDAALRSLEVLGESVRPRMAAWDA